MEEGQDERGWKLLGKIARELHEPFAYNCQKNVSTRLADALTPHLCHAPPHLIEEPVTTCVVAGTRTDLPEGSVHVLPG